MLGKLADRAGLEVDTLLFFTNPLTHGHLKTEALLHLLPAGTVRVAERVSRRLPARIRETCLVQMAARFSKPRARAKRASGRP